MKKHWKRVGLSLFVAGALAGGVLPADLAQAATVAVEAQQEGLSSVTSLAEVYGDGAETAGAALLYPKDIDGSKLKTTDFSVPGKTITGVYTNDRAELTDRSVPGRYVILTFQHVASTPTSQSKHPRTQQEGDEKQKQEQSQSKDAPM